MTDIKKTELEQLREVNKELLEACKEAYRKHSIPSDGGRQSADGLGDYLQNTIAKAEESK